MLKKANQKLWKKFCSGSSGLAAIILLVFTAEGQTAESQTAIPPVPAVKTEKVILQPVFTGYKAVTIGTTADEVREKLGKPEIDDKDGLYYRFSDDEFAQIRLDGDGKVRILSVTYSAENTPKFTDVFGAATKNESKPDGSIYKLVRYPEAGLWVAYSRTAGERPRTTITMQKIRGSKQQ